MIHPRTEPAIKTKTPCAGAAIGRALVHSLRVFLCDEPLSNPDAELRDQMRVELVVLYAAMCRKAATTSS